jgi:hypothetical protein
MTSLVWEGEPQPEEKALQERSLGYPQPEQQAEHVRRHKATTKENN